MNTVNRLWLGVLAAAVVASPAGATTMLRMSLDKLVTSNSAVVVGEVVDVESKWNDEGTFILTEVRFEPIEVLAGDLMNLQLTLTIPGGTVGDRTLLVVGTADLHRGHSYVLFLSRVDLPGAENVLAVRDHFQGAFELRKTASGVRAVSQAVAHRLLPDKAGEAEPPGGFEGLPLETMLDSIRSIARREAAASLREVK